MSVRHLWPRLNRRWLVTVLVLVLVVFPSAALAHALLQRATPAPESLVAASPRQVHLWFSEDLNGQASRIVVWDRHRHDVTAGPARLVPGHPREMIVPLKHLAPGSYLVLWTSVSNEDGHVLHGYYLFSVKIRGPGPSLTGVQTSTGETFPAASTLGSILAHWLELLAAISWFGIALTSAVVFRPGASNTEALAPFDRYRRRLLLVTIGLLVVASTAVLLLVTSALGGITPGDISESLAASYGHLWLARQALALLTVLLVWWLGAQRGALVAAALGAVYLYLFAASGHAASNDVGLVAGSHLVSAAIAVDWIHFLADAIWLGGQIAIALLLIQVVAPARGEEAGQTFLHTLDRFSPLAYLGVGALIVTGAFNGLIHIPSWYAYFHSVYGWTLTVKMALVGLMLLVSGLTTRILRPRIRRGNTSLLPALAGWLRVNPVLGCLVLLATSVMFYYPVPLGLSPPGPSAYTARASGLTATLRISPDRSGPNKVTVTLRDAKGRPVRQAHVTILTTMLDMVMGTQIATMTPAGPGQFAGTADLGMGGRWKLDVLVYRPSGLTRLPIDVTVQD